MAPSLTALMCVQQTEHHTESLSTHGALPPPASCLRKTQSLLLPPCSFWTARGDGGGKLVSSV